MISCMSARLPKSRAGLGSIPAWLWETLVSGTGAV
jgi:hypothetical protein